MQSRLVTALAIIALLTTLAATSLAPAGAAATPQQRPDQTAPVLVIFQYSGLDSDARGTVLVIDQTAYDYQALPISFTWAPGSAHQVSASALVPAGSGKQYVFSSWVNGGTLASLSGTYTVQSGGVQAATASFRTQYSLAMSADPPGSGTLTPGVGSSWQDGGALVAISAAASSGYRFLHWTSTGTGSYSGSSPSSQVTMNGPVTETAHFNTTSTTTSSLTVRVTLNVFVIGSATGGESFISVDGQQVPTPTALDLIIGSTHLLTANSPIRCGAGCQYVYQSWSDRGDEFHTITVPKAPTSYVAVYATQYLLRMAVSPPGGGVTSPTEGQLWQPASAQINMAATPLAGYSFAGWRGEGEGAYTGGDQDHTIALAGPVNETAVFQPAGPLIVTVELRFGGVGSTNGTVAVVDALSYNGTAPLSFRWRAGSNHTIQLQQTIPGTVPGARYVFTGWSNGTGLRWTTGTYTVPVNAPSPSILIANYEAQFQLALVTSPPGANISVAPPTPDGWYGAGASVTLTSIQGAPPAWSVNGKPLAETTRSLTVTMSKPTTVTATYPSNQTQTLQIFAAAILITAAAGAYEHRRRAARGREARRAAKKTHASNVLKILKEIEAQPPPETHTPPPTTKPDSHEPDNEQPPPQDTQDDTMQA